MTTSAPRKKYHLNGGFPGARDEEEHAARGDRGDEYKPEAREQTESECGAAPLHVKARLDVGLEGVEMMMQASLIYAAQLAKGAVEVRKNDEASRETQNADGVEKNRHRQSNPSSRRRRFSRRSIWPESDS